jgi:hypothetical protein
MDNKMEKLGPRVWYGVRFDLEHLTSHRDNQLTSGLWGFHDTMRLGWCARGRFAHGDHV